MMTPQEVANCTFAKAVMGGYNMASVDDFLDKLTEDYAALYKENAALKSKLKVVADKLEEYREVEDAMRSTLLTAQKMASSMVSEAEAKRDALIADAAGAAKRRLEEIQQELADQEQRLADKRREVDEAIAAEERRLAAGQQGLRDFIQSVQSVCQGQLDLLQRLPELPRSLSRRRSPSRGGRGGPCPARGRAAGGGGKRGRGGGHARRRHRPGDPGDHRRLRPGDPEPGPPEPGEGAEGPLPGGPGRPPGDGAGGRAGGGPL